MKNVTLRQLRTFVSVGKHLSFARAAEELALTAPAVSMQIKDLEDQVGLPLFDRSTRAVSLTTVGEYVLAHARRVLAVMRDAEDMVANFKGLKGGKLNLAIGSSAFYFLPKLLTVFCKEHPQIQVQLHSVNSRAQIAQLLRDADVDLAVMGRPSAEWATRAEPFALNALMFVAPAHHPFASMESIAPAALAREPFISREKGAATRDAFDQFMQERHLSATVAMELSSTEAIKQSIIAGMGVGILSIHTIVQELSSGLLATPAVQGFPLMQRWHVVHKANKVLSPAAEAFRYFLLEQGELLLAENIKSARADVRQQA